MIKIIFLILIIFSINIFAQNEWDVASMNVVRLAPGQFPQLPAGIIRDLEQRGCTIPQSFLIKEKHNVIQGEFEKKGQKDWAVLCSKFQTSSILVFRNGSTENVAGLAETEDKDFLQDTGGNRIGFSRIIESADSKYIWDHYNNYGGTEPPQIEYQGINDIFGEKASTVLYFYKGRWLKLQGAD